MGALDRCFGAAPPRHRGLVVEGAIALGGHIHGLLEFSGATLSNLGGHALAADGLRVERAALFRRFRAEGEVRLPAGHIGGRLYLDTATLKNPGGRVLNANRLTVGQDLYLRRGFTAEGEVDLRGTHIGGTIDFSGASLANPSGSALDAGGLRVGQDVSCTEGFTAHGRVGLHSADIGGRLDFRGATLTNPEGDALLADAISVHHSMFCFDGFTALGRVSVGGAHISGRLSFTSATLTNPDGLAMYADGLTVDQDMSCSDGFAAQGEVRMVGAHIGGTLDFDAAALTNPDGFALAAQRLTVDQDMSLREGFTAHGKVHLLLAHIGGQLNLFGATLTDLDLEVAQLGALWLRPAAPPSRVNLTNAKIGLLADDQATWPKELRLDGLIYDALAERPVLSASQRLGWLRRNPRGYSPQPYEQLAAVYRRSGREEDARRIAIAKQQQRRRELSWPGRLWSLLLGALVGHGYRTWYAAGWLLGWLAVGTLVYHHAYPTHMRPAMPDDQVPAFQPVIYALDVLLPVVDLDQQAYWIPQGTALWWTWASILVGWILTTAVVAALTGLLQRD